MRIGALRRVVQQSLWRSRASLGLAGFGVAVGVGALAFFLALSEGMRIAVGRIFPTERVEVVQGGGEGALSLFGGATPLLNASDLEKIRAIRGVADAQPRMRFAFPVKAWGGEEILQGTRYTELIGDGVPAALVDDVPEEAQFMDLIAQSSGRPCTETTSCPRGEYCDSGGPEPQCRSHVPALVSPFLMELYNNYLAPGGGLPRLSRWIVDRARGLTFKVRLGESYVGRSDCGGRRPCQPRTVTMRLAGLSRYAVELGVTVPLAYVRRWNAEYGAEGDGGRYSSVAIRATTESRITSVVAELRRGGYEVPSSRAQQAGLTITIITALLALTSGLIILVAAVNTAHTFFSLVHERQQEIGLYRALGATRADVRRIILAEASLVGGVAGVCGVGLAFAAGLGCDFLWNERVPNFPFKPDSLFTFTPSLILLALVFAVVGCVLGAYLPARRAARLDPARSLQ